jgi:hypothetical protein
LVDFYNLDMIISVGYRVHSYRLKNIPKMNWHL